MRLLQLWTLGLLAATAVWADSIPNNVVNVLSIAGPDTSALMQAPGCGGRATGTISASVSFVCSFNLETFSGHASAETGLGPYGIGASFSVDAQGHGTSLMADTLSKVAL